MISPGPPDQASGHPAKTTWFERNPKKTLGSILIIFSLVCVIGTEKLLSGSVPPGEGYRRFINLREHLPLYSGYIYPTDEDLRNAEFLERKKYLLRVDQNGYIIPSQIHPKADINLVFLGGSTTECLYMDEKERFPYLVGRLIENESHLKVNSYNSGKAGNNSLHSLDILLNKGMYLNPDIVVMMHNINDLIILLFEKSYWNKNKYKAPIVEVEPSIGKNLEQSLIILRDYLIPNISRAIGGIYEQFFLTERKTEFPAIKGEKITINKSQILQDFTANLQIFIDICRNRRILPVLMTLGNRFSDDPGPFIASMMQRLEIQHGISYKEFKEIFDLFNEQIRAVGKANNVLVIDLANKIPQEKKYIYDTVHLTPLGSKLASQVIFEDLLTVSNDLKRNHVNENHN